jgi:hypothetical protein
MLRFPICARLALSTVLNFHHGLQRHVQARGRPSRNSLTLRF